MIEVISDVQVKHVEISQLLVPMIYIHIVIASLVQIYRFESLCNICVKRRKER